MSAVATTVLVVDDEKNIRRTLEMVLSGEGYHVIAVGSAEEALDAIRNPSQPVDLAIFDLKLPGMSGLEALSKLRSEEGSSPLPVIVVSGHATVHDAVNAIKLGASDFFEKPLNRERILVSVSNCIRTARLSRTVEQMREELEARYQMIGTSPAMQRLFTEIDKVAPTKASVFITGESGTGKELVSRAAHRLSPRRDAPFVKVNCAAIPHELIESELFGHEKGSFTGAAGRKRGYFEQAHGGTLFLDEIGDMDLSAQAKVLRALQNGEIVRVGSEHVIHVDVRVLAATNKDLTREVQAGRFREDLFFRLDVFPIKVPALRERPGDVRLLADAFVANFCKDNGLRPKRIDPSVYEVLAGRQWPGNVRELKNVVERAAILSSDIITVADLPEDPHASPWDSDGPEGDGEPGSASLDEGRLSGARVGSGADGARLSLKDYRDAAERAYIVETLQSFDWNISKAAVVLGVERTNLHKKIRSYGIKRGQG
ncbi:MAG: sigma-54-dependent Fis family transcriptional regulator [Polyangiaceae bacterium]|nr:sigma-54-dependent Fis family transcriptional regulator [Polyangiaceae bacterium]MCW5791415.1 sigma-54-dependent Fis family transcriptional regulator [Polyangiaceae bacterium]